MNRKKKKKLGLKCSFIGSGMKLWKQPCSSSDAYIYASAHVQKRGAVGGRAEALNSITGYSFLKKYSDNYLNYIVNLHKDSGYRPIWYCLPRSAF